MKIKAKIKNTNGELTAIVSTNDCIQSLNLPQKPTGLGANINGGELMSLALATCYCNDIYREAAKRNIKVEIVEVEVESCFGGEGEPASGITYHAKVNADASKEEIKELIIHTDRVAEIQNTIRKGSSIKLNLSENSEA